MRQEDYVQPYPLAMEWHKRFGVYFILKVLERSRLPFLLTQVPDRQSHYHILQFGI